MRFRSPLSGSLLVSGVHRPWIAHGVSAALLLLLALPALQPFFQLGLTQSADGMLHVLRTALLAIHQQEGFFYPRWMPDLVLGYGYPLLSFYGPATYYLAAAFVFLGADPALALLLTFSTLLWLAGWGAYCLVYDLTAGVERWRRHAAALVGAVAYLYAPYLLINVYARGAVAEVGAQMLLPWIVWSLRRIVYAENPTPAVLSFALSVGLLALTHNISLIFMPPMILLYGVAVTLQARALPWSLRRRVGAVVLAGFAALGISVFFWLPLLVERSHLATIAFDIAARYVAENTWTVSNFLDLSIPFEYSTAIPFQLGIVQGALALIGFVLMPKRSFEWWALAWMTLLALFLISAWALPLWLHSDVLLIAQFPWRLLAVASLPLAIFPVGIVLRMRTPWAALASAALLIALIGLAQRPTTTAFAPLLNEPVQIGRAATAQFELQTQAFGTSSSSEFLPRWAGVNLFGDVEQGTEAVVSPTLHLEQASPVALHLTITTTAPIALKIANFYFPGWSATIDGESTELRPDPERGLQVLTVPGGAHRIVVQNEGTPLQRAATWGSLVTLMALAIGVWRKGGRQKGWAAVPVCGLALGLYATVQPPPFPQAWLTTNVTVADGTLELLGLRYQVEEGRLFQLFPYWFVRTPADHTIHWRLVDRNGAVLASTSGDAFFNTLRLASIPSSTIFDDAYQLALPPGLAAGEYTLQVGVARPGALPDFATAAVVALPTVPAATPLSPTHPLALRFGSAVVLDGWSVRVDGAAIAEPTPILVVRSGQTLEYTFYWRADGSVEENYHGFVHLLDSFHQAVRQHDKTAGSLLAPSRLWNAFFPQPDGYRFVIDEEMPGGLYYPIVGLYRFEGDGQRLPITDVDGRSLGTELALPPVKVLAPPRSTPAQRTDVLLDTWGELEGFSIDPPTMTVTPGEAITLTLVYRAKGPAPMAYTRFIHVYHPELGMAAQQDAPPRDGSNPTTSWVAGEQIVETVTLLVSPAAPKGDYTIWFGMYDPASGERVHLRRATGESWPDRQYPLATLRVE